DTHTTIRWGMRVSIWCPFVIQHTNDSGFIERF
ncbi:MAG: hypothetical protein ACI9FG_001723, partial [Crocinitomicaceae bacterium]